MLLLDGRFCQWCHILSAHVSVLCLSDRSSNWLWSSLKSHLCLNQMKDFSHRTSGSEVISSAPANQRRPVSLKSVDQSLTLNVKQFDSVFLLVLISWSVCCGEEKTLWRIQLQVETSWTTDTEGARPGGDYNSHDPTLLHDVTQHCL